VAACRRISIFGGHGGPGKPPRRGRAAGLEEVGIGAASIGRDGPRKHGAVHAGTLHRFKGLEYQIMLIADASAGSMPSAKISALRAEYPERYSRQLRQARSLLFVAATRARDVLVITWHGAPSPFLPSAPASTAPTTRR
jgi:superfamily I DNA/RNA helicase